MHKLVDQIKKQDPKEQESLREEATAWESELNDLRNLLPTELTRNSLKQHEIPNLQKQLREAEASLPDSIAMREEVTLFICHLDVGLMHSQAQVNLDSIRRDLKELHTLKQQSSISTELQQTIVRLGKEIGRLEDNLSSTGSVKTADSVQEEIGNLRIQM